MTRFIHDQFAKDYLEELLSQFGECEAPLEVRSEIRQVDVFFAPANQAQTSPEALGLLGKLATTPCLFEPFRNPVTINEIRTCLLKLLEVHTDFIRKGNRENTKLNEDNYPKLWILTPTASSAILEGFGVKSVLDYWGEGIYFLPSFLRTGLVVIHKLPKTLDTLWLRMLGRGRVQQQAIDELEALPETNQFRGNTLLLLSSLRSNLEVSIELEQQDRELIMRLSPLLLEKLEAATQSGIQQGIEQGIQQGIQQGVQQGIEQGIQQGIQQGMQQGIQQGVQQGVQQGMQQGALEKARETALNLSRMGLDDDKIVGDWPRKIRYCGT